MAYLEVFCIADDLTGALESGSKLAFEGLPSLVSTKPLPQSSLLPPDVRALVIDAETRHVSQDEACRRIFAISQAAPPASWIYMKTDSTLRGSIRGAFQGLLAAFRGEPVIYVPAYPEMGRTVRGGRLFVDGRPLHFSAFAADPLDPARESHIPTLLGPEIPVRRIAAPEEVRNAFEEAVYVVDAETDAVVRRAAEAFAAAGRRIAAGPADFVRQIARRAPGARTPARVPSGIRTCLVINGSLHPQAVLQEEAARRNGIPACAPDGLALAFATSPWVLLDTGRLGTTGLRRAADVGEVVSEALCRVDLDAIVVIGGDTAFGILKALGEPVLRPCGDVVEGVPASLVAGADLRAILGAREKDLVLVTKAGGFGPPEVLGSIRERFSRNSSET